MKLKTIRTKISLTYILFAFVILFTLGLIINYELESKIKKDIENNLLIDIKIIEKYISDVPITSKEIIDSNLKYLAAKSNIRITLINNAGIVLLDSDFDLDKINNLENHINRPEIKSSKINPIGVDIRESKSTSIEYFYVAKKVSINTEFEYLRNIGFIRTSISLANLKDQIYEMRKMIFFAGIIVLLFVLIMSVVISKRITKPIMNIVQELTKISKGNYEHQLEVKSDDEIKVLAYTINQIVQKINNDIIELNRLSKVRSQFLANVSHELRTPLFSIEAMLETLLNGALDDKKVNKEYLQRSLAQVDRLNLLLNDLIDIARMESGEQKLSFRYFDLYDLVNSVIDHIKPSADIKKNWLEHIIHPGIPNIKAYGDKEKLHQVLYNLLDNAIKYNPTDTVIKIYYQKEDSCIKISVEDNGVGIPEEHLPRIFERFYRIDKGRSRDSGGTGLGLAIVKHIIEAHGSKAEVHSTVGKGSIFSFSLRI